MLVRKKYALLGGVLAVACQQALAEENDIFKWAGFLNAGYSTSTSETMYDDYLNDKGTWDYTALGLTASVKLPENWSVALQMVAHHGAEDVEMDWGYATYQPSDSLALRLGKIKYPGALISEYVDVGYAIPWFRAPDEFYSNCNLGANMIIEESFNGVAATFTSHGSGSTRYALLPYAGETPVEDGEYKNLFGIKASMSGDGYELMANVNRAKFYLDDTIMVERFTEVNEKYLDRWNIGASYDRGGMMLMTEYGQTQIGNDPNFDTDVGYVSFGYHFGKYLPSVTYSYFDQDSGLGQKTIMLALRREITDFSALKIQIQRVSPDQRRAPFASGEWPSGLFESSPVEDDVNFYGVGYNMVF